MSAAPLLIPSFLFTGEQQYVIVEFRYDLPPGISIITLTFHNTQFFRERIPVTPIGPKAIKAYFPAFSTSGTYTVVPKFNHEEKPAFPCFDIRILSPLEALKLSVLPSSIKSAADHPGSVAAILAYLIKTESSDTQENVDIVDEILLSSVQKIGVPFSDISTFLAGQYGSDNLLHFALRRGLPWTSDWLSNPGTIPPYVAPQWFQSPSHVDGFKPSEIAHQVGLHRTAEQIEEQVKKSGPWQPEIATTAEEKSSGGSKFKMKSIKNAFKKVTDVKDTVTKTANVANYALEKTGEATDFAQNAEGIVSGIGNVDLEVPPVLGEIKDAIDIAGDVKDLSKKIGGVGKYIKKLKKKKSKSNTNTNNEEPPNSSPLHPSGSSGVQLAKSFIAQLKSTALYMAQMSGPYTCSSEAYGHITLKAGDVVHVIREDSNGMCKGIANERYCEFPRNLLQALENDDENYYDSGSEDNDSEYEEVKYFDDSELDQKQASPVKNTKFLEQKMRSHSIESGLNHRVAPLPLPGFTKPDTLPHKQQQQPHCTPPQSPLIKREHPPHSPIVGSKPTPPLPPKKLYNEKSSVHDRPLPEIPNTDQKPLAHRESSPQSPAHNKPKQHFFPPPTEHHMPREVIHTPSRILNEEETVPPPPVGAKPTPPLPPKKPSNKSPPLAPRERQERDNAQYFKPVVHQNWSEPATEEPSTPPPVPSKHNTLTRNDSPLINRKQVEPEDSPGPPKRALLPKPVKEIPPTDNTTSKHQWTPRPPYVELTKLNNNNSGKAPPPAPLPKHDSPSLTRPTDRQQGVEVCRLSSLEKKNSHTVGAPVKKTPPPPPIRCDSSLSKKGDTLINSSSPRLMRPPIKAKPQPQHQIPIDNIDEEYDDTAQFRKYDEEEQISKQPGIKNLIAKLENKL